MAGGGLNVHFNILDALGTGLMPPFLLSAVP